MPRRSRRKSRSDSITISLKWLSRLPVWLFVVVGVLVVGGSGGLIYAAHLEENDAFCASCHSEPELTYFQRNQAATPVDLSSWHHGEATRCIDCHSGGGVFGRLSGISVGAIDLAWWISGQARQPAPLTVPIGDGNCTKCHTDTTQTTDFNLHFHAFLPRWQAIDPNAAGCVDCHPAHKTDGDPNLMFIRQDQVGQVCDRCHQSGLGEGGG